MSLFNSSYKFLTPKKVKKIKLFLCILPFIIFVFIFFYFPLFGWVYAFFDYRPGVPLNRQQFTGLLFFKLMFSGTSGILLVLRNTLAMSFLNILSSPVPVIFAILLTEAKSKYFTRIVQTITSIPNFISWVLVYSIFFTFLSSNEGVINAWLLKAGIISMPLDILGNNKWAWINQLFIGLWKGTGWGAIIYFAAITSIDSELYDAAEVDGCNRWQKIMNVTVPGIMPTFFVLLMLSISNMLSNGFEQFWVFQNPMTLDKLEVLDTYIYRLGIYKGEISFSTAMGALKSIVSIILLTFANTLSKKIRGSSVF